MIISYTIKTAVVAVFATTAVTFHLLILTNGNNLSDMLMKNRTTFVIAHRLSTVRNANAIMVLEQGEIIERGTHEELLELGGRYFELYTGLKELD